MSKDTSDDGSNCHAVAIIRPEQLPPMQPGWRPINTAPKDGSHFLACVEPAGGFDERMNRGFNQYPPAVVHWFGWPEDAVGFYLSRTLIEQTKPDEYTHWRPIPRWLEDDPAPAALTADAELARLRAEVEGLRTEVAELDGLRDRLAELLTGVAAALRGPPPPDTAWSWHDLPELAAASVADVAALRTALRFYARSEHYALDDDEDFDSVSGEPENWLCSGLENSTTMVEDGEIARRALRGEPINWTMEGEDCTPAPIDGEKSLNAAIDAAMPQEPTK